MMIQVKPIDPTTGSLNKPVYSKPSLLTKWRDFASNTTIHGLKYVVETSLHICRRVVWAIFLFTAASAYFYYSTLSFEKFLSRPIRTEISQETPVDGLNFPAVTICNLNQLVRSKIDITDEDENFEKLGLNISGCSETRSVRGNLTCGQALLCAFRDYANVLVDNCNKTTQQNILNVLNNTKRIFDEETFLANYGHDLLGKYGMSEVNGYCLFSQKMIECSEQLFAPIVTSRGICYTFNSGNTGAGKPFRSQYEGTDLGLTIVLDVQTNESTFSESSSGLRLIVHDQDTFVNHHSGFIIYPGAHASVAVKLTQVRIKLTPKPYQTTSFNP